MARNDDTVAARTPDMPADLQALGDRLLDEARESSDGRAAVTLNPHPSSDGGPKQTLVAARAGTDVGPRDWNAPPSLQVLRGTVRVSGFDTPLSAGYWTQIIDQHADVEVEDDAVILLVVDTPNG